MLEIAKVEVSGSAPPMLSVTFTTGETNTFPLHPPMIAILNAGGWLMREYVAKVFEDDLGGANLVSRRIRLMQAGERAPAPRPQRLEAAAG